MGTNEDKKNSIPEISPSRKPFDKPSDIESAVFPAKAIGQPVDHNAEKQPDSNIFQKVKFEVYGEEMISKEVKQSGNSGRVYLPPDWIGKNIKIIRID